MKYFVCLLSFMLLLCCQSESVRKSNNLSYQKMLKNELALGDDKIKALETNKLKYLELKLALPLQADGKRDAAKVKAIITEEKKAEVAILGQELYDKKEQLRKKWRSKEQMDKRLSKRDSIKAIVKNRKNLSK